MITTEAHGRKFEIDGRDLFSPAEECALEDWLRAMKAQDAAEARHRSVETVNTHRKAIREKTHQHNGEGVLIFCISKGYIRALVVALTVSGLSAMEVQVRNVRNPPKNGKPVTVQVARIHRHEIAGVIA